MNPPTPNPQTEPRKGQVVVEWKCRGRHEGCMARTWRFYSFLNAEEAKDAVPRWNHYTPNFSYRVKPGT